MGSTPAALGGGSNGAAEETSSLEAVLSRSMWSAVDAREASYCTGRVPDISLAAICLSSAWPPTDAQVSS